MKYQVTLENKDLVWIIKKLSPFYVVKNIRQVIYFLSHKVKNDEEEDTNG